MELKQYRYTGCPFKTRTFNFKEKKNNVNCREKIRNTQIIFKILNIRQKSNSHEINYNKRTVKHNKLSKMNDFLHMEKLYIKINLQW